MPIYILKCEECGRKVERIQGIVGEIPLCCGKTMTKLPTLPAIIKIIGESGVPARSKGYKEGYSKEYLKSLET